MSLAGGTKLGPYEIIAPIGAGGMGEVYKARDTKLGREVAIKVLPEVFAENKERLARFEREARLLASLNHPNIATLFDLQESDGTHFLVLEFVPGETLAEQIKKGPIEIDEALPLFKQIAEALEAAHEKDIIHRDLKPANIKVAPDGKVKVLDFGLAKALAGEVAAQDLSESPTLTRNATQTGVLLGTAPYMSPEQARGKEVDKRTDIWAFGCCLFEALTGQAAFLGETVSDTLAKVLEHPPDWAALPETTPGRLRDLLLRCLRKDVRLRIRDVWDIRIELEEPFPEPASSAVRPPEPFKWRRLIPWSLAVLSVAVAIWSLMSTTRGGDVPLVRFAVPTQPLEDTLLNTVVAVSPDGTRLVYSAGRSGAMQLYLHNMDSLDSTPISGTEGAYSPFFSPDGQWVGFFSNSKLKKVPLAGGAPQVLCNAPGRHGATWSPDDIIIFSPDSNSGLLRISASGGAPETITTLDSASGETSHRWPEFLPGGRAVLFTVGMTGHYDDALIAVMSLDTGERRTLIKGGTHAVYAPTGHLVYARKGSLLAVPFDLERLDVTGPSFLVFEGIRTESLTGVRHFSFSEDVLLSNVAGGANAGERALVWVNRRGETEPLTDDRQAYFYPRLSPDGTRLAIAIDEGARVNVWLYELASRRLTRLTFQGLRNRPLIWTPDGKRVTYASTQGGPFNLFWKSADGSGTEQQLLAAEYNQFPTSWSPDGEVLAFTEFHPTTGEDIWLLELRGEREARPYLRTSFNENEAAFSPSGRWLAYTSDESGRDEVYVQPLPESDGKWQISTDGGFEPVWASDGRELFYRNGDKMMAVAIETENGFTADKPRILFEGRYLPMGLGNPHYDISSDGQRFLMIQEEEQTAPTQLHAVLNWFEELKQRVPTN